MRHRTLTARYLHDIAIEQRAKTNFDLDTYARVFCHMSCRMTIPIFIRPLVMGIFTTDVFSPNDYKFCSSTCYTQSIMALILDEEP